MVFEVMGTEQAPRLVDAPERAAGTVVQQSEPRPTERSLPDGVISQLLRSAIALQAEGLLRTAGALSGTWGAILDRSEWIERDARDLAALAAAATAAKVPLPAGVDTGAGDPDHPSSVVEGMLAAHEVQVRILRELADAGGDPNTRPWLPLVAEILGRREEEMLLLRAVGAAGNLPAEEGYVRGCPPRR